MEQNHAHPPSQEMEQQEALSSRVESILTGLRPIQDLAKNWDIDIASCLEEYLNDLLLVEGGGGMVLDGSAARLSSSLNDSSNSHTAAIKMNFAKAALVLHNSSHIYSRKVEYLHGLVLTALKNISHATANHNNTNNNNSSRHGKSRQESSDDVDEFWDFDPHQDFLLLDDVLPIDKTPNGRHINLVSSQQELELTQLFTAGRGHREGSLATTATTPNHRTMSLEQTTTVNNTTGQPTQLLLSGILNAHGGTGTASSVHPSFWLGGGGGDQQQQGNGSSLRLMNGVCELEDTGRLVLPGSQSNHKATQNNSNPNYQNNSKNNAVASSPLLLPPPNEDVDNDFAMMDQQDLDDNDHDHDDDGPGFSLIVPQEEGEKNPPVAEAANRTAAPVLPVTTNITTASRMKNRPDPWALYDPHEPMLTSSSSKPLKLGKTIQLPACLKKKKPTREEDNGMSKEEEDDDDDPFLNNPRSIALQAYRALKKKQTQPDDDSILNIPWTGLIHSKEFSALARRLEQQRRRTLKRQRQEQQGQENHDFYGIDENRLQEEPGDNDDNTVTENNNDGYFHDWGGDDHDDFDGGGGDYGDDVDDPPNDYYDPNGPIETNTGLTSVDQMYRRDDDADSEFRQNQRTFEELCRAHIAAFARGAEKYAASTKLTRRVDAWQARLGPLLAAEEERPVFDIHVYSQTVVDRLVDVLSTKGRSTTNPAPLSELKAAAMNRENASHNNGDKSSDKTSKESMGVQQPEQQHVPFSEIVQGRPSYEVCRYFLATLSLCNSGNVDFVYQKNHGLEKEDNDGLLYNNTNSNLHVQLLSSQVEHPMEAYLAPSAAAGQ